MTNLKDDLIKKILNNKAYPLRVRKYIVSTQIAPRKEVTQKLYDEALSRLDIVFPATKKLLNKCDKLRKQVVSLERHLYAPEVNKLKLINGYINTPQKTDVEAAIKYAVLNNSKV